MENVSVEKLAEWADGRACGVTIPALGAYLSLGIVREFLDGRRSRSGPFSVPPIVDLKKWIGLYHSPKVVEGSVIRAICREGADEMLRLIGAMRNPKAADEETRLMLFWAIIGFFAKPTGPEVAEFLAVLLRDDGDEGDEQALQDPAFQFAFWVELPCWLIYGHRPYQLLRIISSGGEETEETVRCLVRLDHQVVAHPVI